jgi:hypothetical protein
MLLLLESIVFEDCQNQWSLSRPLMCLIMLLPEHYEQVMRARSSASVTPSLQN